MAVEKAENKRKKLIKLIHIGKGKMALTDDAYRAFLSGTVGKDSCTTMSIRQLETVLRVMRKNGFDSTARRVSYEERGGATLEQLEYIKGMWAKCARNKSDKALTTFVNRIARVKTLRFLTVETAQKVMLALRDMMVKAGFDPDTSEVLDDKT